MFLLASILVVTIAIVYFYLLGIRFFALLPVIFLVAWGIYFLIKHPLSFSQLPISKYSLHIAWIIVILAMFGILSFLGIKFPLSFLRIIIGNMLLRFASYAVGYTDGKKIFQFGYYSTLCIFFLVGIRILPKEQISEFLLLLLSLRFGSIGFLKSIVGIFFPVEDDMVYTILISGLFLLCGRIIFLMPSLPSALWIISMVLFVIYTIIWQFLQNQPTKNTKISIRRILAGERIHSKKIFSNSFLATMYRLSREMPVKYRYLLESINILVILVLFINFMNNWNQLTDIQHLLYRVVIAFFIGNVLILKKIEYTSFLQNLFLFLVIHFAVYVSLFSYFESNISSIVFWSVAWNILTSLALFVSPTSYQKLFSHKDYRYRIVASIASFFVNVFLLLKSSLAGELIFFLLLLYIGIESMLIFYGIKHTNKTFSKD